jgi:hypothetical protein
LSADWFASAQCGERIDARARWDAATVLAVARAVVVLLGHWAASAFACPS